VTGNRPQGTNAQFQMANINTRALLAMWPEDKKLRGAENKESWQLHVKQHLTIAGVWNVVEKGVQGRDDSMEPTIQSMASSFSSTTSSAAGETEPAASEQGGRAASTERAAGARLPRVCGMVSSVASPRSLLSSGCTSSRR